MCELGLSNMNTYSRGEWKREVSRRVEEKNYNDLMKIIKTYKKLDYAELSCEEFNFKPYLNKLNLSDARTRMRLRANMINNIKFNFQSDPQFTKENWKCSCDGDKSPIQSQKHMEICPKFMDIRQQFDIDTDEGIVRYFDAILRRLEDEDDRELE